MDVPPRRPHPKDYPDRALTSARQADDGPDGGVRPPHRLSTGSRASRTGEDRIKVLIASNSDWVVPVTEDERRFLADKGCQPFLQLVPLNLARGAARELFGFDKVDFLGLLVAGELRAAERMQVVRGERARWAHHDPRPCLIPPDWSGGYTSIFALQQKEEKEAA